MTFAIAISQSNSANQPPKCYVEKWIDGIHWDTKYSPDILDSLEEVYFILNELFTKTPQRVSHHW